MPWTETETETESLKPPAAILKTTDYEQGTDLTSKAPSVDNIMAEIHRINDPEAWQGEGLSQLPFYMPDECDPWWHNTILVPRAAFCDRFWVNDCPSEQRMDEWPEYY
ncbi:hypothetical protein TRIATDRAFT_305516 [Trichoderma atroviride IMI 206040]|uniref:Uncharacterized protein n=1 Tax=Hypocrea atroviridis (strain ATCC 20476 / IMI 206040) TaxID=452589 RepID=G9NLE9_HYPAI|nr:uncharacterized protein TRIATDRAFT_305516 [Trichoderma atroviride IMI 206040]EHK48712.1 hypothetical protein TRIATDRAFT_305516 [Trichoderma atroviride IMI 206040]